MIVRQSPPVMTGHDGGDVGASRRVCRAGGPVAPQTAGLARPVQAVAGVPEARTDVSVFVQLPVDRRDVDLNIGDFATSAFKPSGAASRQAKLMWDAPACLRRRTAAIAEWPVASIGSITITSRSWMSSGSFR